VGRKIAAAFKFGSLEMTDYMGVVNVKRETKDKREIKGLKIRSFNIGTIVVAFILYSALLCVTVVMSLKYDRMLEANDNFTASQADAKQVERASDYLTEQVRLYAINMEPKYMENYFYEVNTERNREEALEDLKSRGPSKTALRALESALECSNDLMSREIYSMRLISTANGYSEEMLPEEVQDMALQKADLRLPKEEMIQRARAIVFDQGYQDAKALIESHLNYFTDSILEDTEEAQNQSFEGFSQIIFQQRILVTLLFIMNVTTFVVITALIVRPLKIYIQCIKEKELFEIVGAYEFKYLALTYNDIYEMNNKKEEMLRHKAEHDTLTGLMNREAFGQLQQLFQESPVPMALLLIDVDHFKNVNDTYGHETGDAVLKKVANVLESYFRSNDYTIRIGGDEFAVLLVNITRENGEVIHNKVGQINARLQNPDDGLPAVSLSVGVAFSRSGYQESLYRNADRAMYQVKENGRCGCRFYEGD